QKLRRSLHNRVDRSLERLFVNLRRLIEAADLAYELQRRRLNLFRRSRRIEVEKHLDISAHVPGPPALGRNPLLIYSIGRFAMQRMAGLLHWPGSGYFFITGDEGTGVRKTFFDRRRLQRSFVARLALPYFGDPKNIFVDCVLGDDEAEASGNGVRVIASHESDQFVTTPRRRGKFHDETVHGGTSKRVYRLSRLYRHRSSLAEERQACGSLAAAPRTPP